MTFDLRLQRIVAAQPHPFFVRYDQPRAPLRVWPPKHASSQLPSMRRPLRELRSVAGLGL